MAPRALTPARVFTLRLIGVTALLVLHGGALWALLRFDWRYFLASIALWQITAPLGISICYHRYYNHRSLELHPALKRTLLFLGCLCGQLGPMRWVRVHRVHHRHAETESDPHSPRHGFWHSHFGWLLELHRRARIPELHSWPADLLEDRDCVFFERAYPYIQVGALAAFYLLGGWDAVLWLGFFRICITLHSIWTINSFAHTFGYRNFDAGDDSTNLRGWALFTAGEALHNNHHAHQRSARFSVLPGEIDLCWLAIRGFAAMGWAWNVRHYDPALKGMAMLNPRDTGKQS
jgi:stearoyl-CoA desaturase (delta-9 desaturase)